MKRRLLVIASLFLLIILVTDSAEAQRRRKPPKRKKPKGRSGSFSNFRGSRIAFTPDKKYASIGVNVNAFNYFGDLAPLSNATSFDISFTRPGFGVFGEYRVNPYSAVRATINYGRIQGDDNSSADIFDLSSRGRYVRNLHFRNDIIEFGVDYTFDFIPNPGNYRSRVLLTPYIFVGVAGFYHNPQAVVPDTDLSGNAFANAGEWVSLRDLGTEGQNTTQVDAESYGAIGFAIPFGGGVRYKLNQFMDLSFEIGYRYAFTDYLDDVSGQYLDLGVFGDNELAKALHDRSREARSARTGDERNFGAIGTFTNNVTYTSVFDGETYTVIGGFGSGLENSPRGNPDNNDWYIVTSFKLSYILGAGGGSIRNAKFR